MPKLYITSIDEGHALVSTSPDPKQGTRMSMSTLIKGLARRSQNR